MMTAISVAYSNLADQKKALRQQILSLRGKMTTAARQTASTKICARLLALPQLQQASVIAAFAPMVEEVAIWPVLEALWAKDKTICFPRVADKHTIIFHRIGNRAELCVGYKNILEPLSTAPIQQHIDFAIIPAIAIDIKGNRLGYGGGFYDTFLSKQQKTLACAAVFACQFVDEVPITADDHCVSLAVSENIKNCKIL